jgi:hypothetical protein
VVKYVFLDFDGVLNSAAYIAANKDKFKAPLQKTYYIVEHIDPTAVARLNLLIAKTGANVVISTAWRKAFNLTWIAEILANKGFKGEIVGETPILYCDRGLEIQAWMDAAQVIESQIVILDDMDTMLHLKPRQVMTHFDVGMQDEHLDKALELLGFAA